MQANSQNSGTPPPTMPLGLRCFVLFALLFIAFDASSLDAHLARIRAPAVPITGWNGSMPYLMSIPIVLLILLASHFPHLVRRDLLWLRYVIMLFMLLEMLRGLLAMR